MDNAEVVKNPKYKSEMIFLDERLATIKYEKPKPNIWWRFWQWFLLGIKWRDAGAA